MTTSRCFDVRVYSTFSPSNITAAHSIIAVTDPLAYSSPHRPLHSSLSWPIQIESQINYKTHSAHSQNTRKHIPCQHGTQQIHKNIKRSHYWSTTRQSIDRITKYKKSQKSPRGLTEGIYSLFLKTTILHFVISSFLDRHFHSKSPTTEQSYHYAHHRRGSHHHRRHEPKRTYSGTIS